MYPEDKYKVDCQVEESEFEESEFFEDLGDLIGEWFGDEEIELTDAVPSIKYLNEDLDEENDKYAKYKKDKVRVRSKSTAKQQPIIYDADKSILTDEADILKVSNGCKINIFFAPYCYGDQKAYRAWLAKMEKAESEKDPKKKLRLVKKLMEDRPVFGIALGLQAVQFLGGTAGRAQVAAMTADMLDDAEVSADDIDLDDESDDDSDESVDLS